MGAIYAGSFYNPGDPPWPTADGTGGWGFDHSHPMAVAAMPATARSRGRVFLGWHEGECGVGFIGLNGSGRKIWEWLRRGAGAYLIAAAEKHVYFCFDGDAGRRLLGRVNPDNGEQAKFATGQFDVLLRGKPTGLAVYGQTAAVSLGERDKVVILDAETGNAKGELNVPHPGSLVFASDGELWGVSNEKEVFRSRAPYTSVHNVTPAGIKRPAGLAHSKPNVLALSDYADMNIKLFQIREHNLEPFGTVGEPGGHQPGPWNPNRMHNPAALAFEERAEGGRWWVVESHLSPRRVSVWDSGGRFLRDYIGNTRYSGNGGLLSDDIPEIGFVDGVIYQLDYATQTYTPMEIMGGSPAPAPGKTNPFVLGLNTKSGGSFGNGYHFVSEASGKPVEYYVEAADAVPMIFLRRSGRWQCVAALGPASSPLARYLGEAPNETSVFAWNDRNADGYPSTDEVTWRDVGRKHVLNGGWGYRCDRQLVFYHSGWKFAPARFSADGAPLYDVAQAQLLPADVGQVNGDVYRTRFGYLARKHAHGHFDYELLGFDESGKQRWSYPDWWSGVHGAFTAPMALPGVLMGHLKVTGLVPNGDHDIIAIRGNAGQEFLLRDDGLYIAELFTDQRMAPSDLPPTRDILGTPINDTSLGGEPFSGWIGRQRDGKVRMTYGYTDVRVAEVVGLDSVRELPPQRLTFSAPEVAACRTFHPQSSVPVQDRVYRVRPGAALGTNYAEAAGIRSGREEVGLALLRYDATNLYAGWRVFDTTPLVNQGTFAPLAFKSGDSVNLFVAGTEASARGSRILLTHLRGKPLVVVYEPEAAKGEPYTFESPVRKVTFQNVAVSTEVSFTVQVQPTGYEVMAQIPWRLLGIRPRPGLELRGDFGILFGDATGNTTAQRVQWADPETNVVNDVPTEAEFTPLRWGKWILE